MTDGQALLWLYAYALAVVGLFELAARRWAWAAEKGRKAIHILVGALPFGIVLTISDRAIALLAPASFVVLNWLSNRLRLSRAMDSVGRQSLGTVYYPLSLLILILWLWDTPARPLAAVAMLPMIIGDAAAATVGTRWGARTPGLELPPDGRKSLAGSLAMLIGSWLSLRAGLIWMLSTTPAATALIATHGLGATVGLGVAALSVAVAVTFVEAVSPAGTDNLTVPLTSAALLWWLGFGPGSSAALLIAFGCAAIVAFIAWRVQALSDNGAVAAVLVGGLIGAVGGWPWAAVLLAFFISSSRLSRLKARVAAEPVAAKGSRRDWRQVLANGGVPALAAILAAAGAGPWTAPLLLGAFAAATADTWATEIGGLSRRPPRLVTSGREVPAGTSGGITPLGTAASVGGALLIAVAGLAAPNGVWFWSTLAGGIAGCLFDSVLGATLQSVNWCPTCSVETERPVHRCGTATVHRRGLPWLDNDAVNFIATLFGGLVAVLLSLA